MTNTSATGGYLAPASPPPDEDAALDAVLQTMVAGITGLPGNLVRPRWQAVPTPQPQIGVSWCAIGVIETDSAANVSITHNSAGEGADGLQHHEVISVQASFYGPQAGGYAAFLRDGVYLAQNREALYLAGMALIETGAMVSAPELFNQQWIRRVDLALKFRRRIDRVYPVLNVQRAQGTITSDDVLSPEPFTVEP